MAQPSDTNTRTFKVVTAAGVAVTGLTGASFTLTAFRNGSSSSITPTITEISGGRYSLAYALPSTGGIVDVYFDPVSASNFVEWPDLSEELEAHDLTSLYGAVAKPTIVLNASGAPTNEVELKFIKEDYHEVTFTVRNSDGTAVDLVAEGYTGWRFGVKNEGQTTVASVVPYLQTTGITGAASGVVTIVVPETASFFGLLAAGVAATTGARWSLEANEGGDAAKTRTLGRGGCVVMRKETL
jgi:hypothetical protein